MARIYTQPQEISYLWMGREFDQGTVQLTFYSLEEKNISNKYGNMQVGLILSMGALSVLYILLPCL